MFGHHRAILPERYHSSDDEQVTNLMLNVDNLSRVQPFNILDSETRRKDVFEREKLFTLLRWLIQMLTRILLHHRLSGVRHVPNCLLYLMVLVNHPPLILLQRDPRSPTKRLARALVAHSERLQKTYWTRMPIASNNGHVDIIPFNDILKLR